VTVLAARVTINSYRIANQHVSYWHRPPAAFGARSGIDGPEPVRGGRMPAQGSFWGAGGATASQSEYEGLGLPPCVRRGKRSDFPAPVRS
jgi:hypothetical protein